MRRRFVHFVCAYYIFNGMNIMNIPIVQNFFYNVENRKEFYFTSDKGFDCFFIGCIEDSGHITACLASLIGQLK